MMFGLKQQLKEGETVALTLVFASAGNKGGKDKREKVVVQARVQPLTYQFKHTEH
jgi:copper(I)-binding protein